MKKLSKLTFILATTACAFFSAYGQNYDVIDPEDSGSSKGKALYGNASGTKFCCGPGSSTCSGATNC